MQKKIMALITARGGSKGLPNKNILPLAGKPVIAWTIEAARGAVLVDRVIVSTDSAEIAAVARAAGAEIPFMRPSELAADNTSHNAVVLHAVNWLLEHENYRPDFLLLLQPTSPLRTAGDIDDAIRLALESDGDGVVSVFENHHHPLLMNKIGEDGYLESYIADRPQPGSEGIRRQNLSHVFSDNGAIYIIKTDYLLQYGKLRAPRTKPFIMPENRSLQIDSKWDFELIEYVLTRK